MIELAKASEIQTIKDLADIVKAHMNDIGIKQWTGSYPEFEVFRQDFDQQALYVYKDDNQMLAAITLLPENDEAYKEITWHRSKSLVIHRIIVDPSQQHRGIGRALFNFAKELAFKFGYESIKVDTHPDNFKMQSLIIKCGYQKVGYLSQINRLAYELVL